MKNIPQKQNENKQLMNESEIREFVKSLLMEAHYHNYALDGFIFLFKTFSEMAEQNNVRFLDLCADLQRFIYAETIHCSFSEEKYADSIHDRYRQTDYTQRDKALYDATKTEVFETESHPLDLSNCSVEDLSLKISEVMHNPNLPTKLHDCLAEELCVLVGGQVGKSVDSPEVIKNAILEDRRGAK